MGKNNAVDGECGMLTEKFTKKKKCPHNVHTFSHTRMGFDGALAEWDAGSSLGGSVLGDGFGALGDCVLGQLTRQQQTHGGLDFAAGDG